MNPFGQPMPVQLLEQWYYEFTPAERAEMTAPEREKKDYRTTERRFRPREAGDRGMLLGFFVEQADNEATCVGLVMLPDGKMETFWVNYIVIDHANQWFPQ